MTAPKTRVARLMSLVAAITLVLAIAGPAHAVSVRVRGRNQAWHPPSVTVATGTRVVWKAVDTTHTVTAYRGNWSKDTRVTAGNTTSFTFHNAGTYKFRCTIHSSIVSGQCQGMCGKVVVT